MYIYMHMLLYINTIDIYISLYIWWYIIMIYICIYIYILAYMQPNQTTDHCHRCRPLTKRMQRSWTLGVAVWKTGALVSNSSLLMFYIGIFIHLLEDYDYRILYIIDRCFLKYFSFSFSKPGLNLGLCLVNGGSLTILTWIPR